MYNKIMKNDIFLNSLKSNQSFSFKFILNKKIKIIYYAIPFLLLFTLLITSVIFLSISNSKQLTIVGAVLCAISFFVMIIILIMNYFEKKFRYKVKDFFNLKNIIGSNLTETEMYNRDFLSIYHHEIPNTREIKWNTKTYNVNNLQLRATYINCFDDSKKILLNGKYITQIYLQKELNKNNNKYIISKNSHENFCSIKNDNYSFFVNNKDIKIDNQIIEVIEVLEKNNINFDIYVDGSMMNIYFIENDNFLYINLEQKFNEQKFINDFNLINRIIDEIKN